MDGTTSSVVAGLVVPAIHVLSGRKKKKDVDARDKRGHDVERIATDRIECPNGFIGNRSQAQAKGGRTAQRRPPNVAACLVRPASAPTAVAAAAGRSCRSLSRLVVGNHAAADRRQNGGAVFREIPGALA